MDLDNNPYYLFAKLVKRGAEWRGDACMKKYCEMLFVPPEKVERVLEVLEAWDEGVDYAIDRADSYEGCLWVYIIAK